MTNKTVASNLWINLYVLVAIAHIMSIVIGHDMLNMVSKYLLMPVLFVFVLSASGSPLNMRMPVLIAVFFSWVGDAFLMFTERDPMYFTLGLAGFLLAHISYIVAFRKWRDPGQARPWQWKFSLLVIAYAIGLCIMVYPGLGDMRIPVILYAAVISAMCIAANGRYGRTNVYSYGFVLAGAVIFVASDSMIAWNTFYQPFALSRLLIMCTYIIAQYLIVTGLLQHRQNETAHTDASV